MQKLLHGYRPFICASRACFPRAALQPISSAAVPVFSPSCSNAVVFCYSRYCCYCNSLFPANPDSAGWAGSHSRRLPPVSQPFLFPIILTTGCPFWFALEHRPKQHLATYEPTALAPKHAPIITY